MSANYSTSIPHRVPKLGDRLIGLPGFRQQRIAFQIRASAGSGAASVTRNS